MNYVSFYGSETSGSVAKRNLAPQKRETISGQQCGDSVCFRGNADKSDTAESVGKSIVGLALFAAAVIGGLGYVHKTNAIGKLNDGKIKTFLEKSNKITKQCYNLCHKTKDFAIKYYNKVKDFFTKKS